MRASKRRQPVLHVLNQALRLHISRAHRQDTIDDGKCVLDAMTYFSNEHFLPRRRASSLGNVPRDF